MGSLFQKNYLTSDDIKKCFEKSSYGEYFAFMINQLSRDKVVMQEVGHICETNYMVILRLEQTIYNL